MSAIKGFQNRNSADRPTRVVPWLAVCAILCPIVSMALLTAGFASWTRIASAASVMTVALFDNVEGIRAARGNVAETITLTLAATLAALAPSLSIGLFERTWFGKVASVVMIYPGWVGVMGAPAIVVYLFSWDLDTSLLGVRLSYQFLVAFSAAATSVALAYALWVRLHPETDGRRAQAAPAGSRARFHPS